MKRSDTRTLLEHAGSICTWNVNKMLDVLCAYVDNQNLHGDFRVFIARQVRIATSLEPVPKKRK